MLDGRRVLDADGHVIEPGHLFAPWTCDRLPMDLAPGTPMEPCGDVGRIADQLEHGFDPPSYLRAMDAQGIDAAVLYPSIGLFVPYLPELTPEQSADACRAYGEWIAAYCDADDGRLFGAGILPLADLDLAVAEVDRSASAGLVAMMARPNHLYGRNIGDAAYAPVLDAVATAGLVLAIHEGLGLRGHPTIGADRFTEFGPRHAMSHPMEQMAAMASLLFDGAFERHPDLRVAFLESGTGWLPYWLHRLDEHCEWLAATGCSDLCRNATECFGAQCAISSEAEDALAASVVAAVGADHVMWASDFPHPDAVYPGAARAFVANLCEHGTAASAIDDVLWAAPADLYRLHDRTPGGHR
jgi:predicted TIM-barrel fold metal-dependent hydrolase